jgi:hypothetical protein
LAFSEHYLLREPARGAEILIPADQMLKKMDVLNLADLTTVNGNAVSRLEHEIDQFHH